MCLFRMRLASAQTKTVLSNLNLDIRAGEFVAVLGETGCGKSTLLRLVLGQEFPTLKVRLMVDGKLVAAHRCAMRICAAEVCVVS